MDATNALLPAVSVITPIGWDHMDMLGDSLAKIAGEKAGIIKLGVPVITMPQAAEALEVIQTTAAERGAPLTVIETPWSSETGLPGPHQRWNAAIAVASCSVIPSPRVTPEKASLICSASFSFEMAIDKSELRAGQVALSDLTPKFSGSRLAWPKRILVKASPAPPS